MLRAVPSHATKLLLGILLLVSVVLLSATAATTRLAGDPARRVTENRSGRTRSGNAGAARSDSAQYAEHRNVSSARTLIDSVVTELGSSPELDSASLRRIVAVVAGDRASDFGVWIDAGELSQPADSADLELFRAWARAPRLPSFWGYRTQFTKAPSIYSIPVRSLQPLKRFVLLNGAAADSTLAAGDTAQAVQRAFENIGAARQLLDQPITMDVLVGRVLLLDAARLLERIGQQTGDIAQRALADRLVVIANTTYRLTGNELRRMYTVAEDGTSPDLSAIAGDRALHPAVRLMALQAAVEGACVHTREVLTGASASRHVTLDTLLALVRDIPRSDELAPLYYRTLEQFDTPSAELLTRAIGLNAAEGVRGNLAALTPRSVRRRVAYCSMLM